MEIIHKFLLPWVHPDTLKEEMNIYMCSVIFSTKDISLPSLSLGGGCVDFLTPIGILISYRNTKEVSHSPVRLRTVSEGKGERSLWSPAFWSAVNTLLTATLTLSYM